MKNLKISVDSGAHSMYRGTFSPGQLGFYKDRDDADYSYLESESFQAYLDDYISWLHENKKNLEMYVSLDIIFNAKASWDMQKYMESCGLMPVPVFHQGEDWKYLKRYVDNYEYIGLGGLAQNSSAKAYIRFADEAFKIICDSTGKPRTKVHGFAMTSMQLMKRYPWYSCDSSTWVSLSRNGWVRFPRLKKNGEYDWLANPIAWRFTDRARHSRVHIDRQQDAHVEIMEQYLAEKFDLSIGELVDYADRDACNIGHTLLVSEQLEKYYEETFNFEGGANIYLAGHGVLLLSVANFKRIISIASRSLQPTTQRYYLGSYFYKNQIDRALLALKPTKRRKLHGV